MAAIRQGPVTVRQSEANGKNSKGSRCEDDGRPPADAVTCVTKYEAADQRAHEAYAENVAELDPIEVVLGSKVRRRKADQVRVKAVEERDDPRNDDQTDKE